MFCTCTFGFEKYIHVLFGLFALWFRYGLPIKFVVVRLRPKKNKKGGGGGCGGVVGGGGDGWLWWLVVVVGCGG